MYAFRVELYTVPIVAKWMGTGSARLLKRCRKLGIEPTVMLSPVSGKPRLILDRDQVMKLLVAYYNKKGRCLEHSRLPKIASE